MSSGSQVRPAGRYVAIPADAIVDLMEEIGRAVSTQLGNRDRPGSLIWSEAGRERVATIVLPGHASARPAIRVYTSLARGAERARECGEDAIRVVVGVWHPDDAPAETVPVTFTGTRPRDVPGVPLRRGFVPREAGVRVFRTAPALPTETRRIGAFLVRLRDVLRAAYVRARDLTCRECGRVVRVRDGQHGRFLGCSGYPECRATRPIPQDSAGFARATKGRNRERDA